MSTSPPLSASLWPLASALGQVEAAEAATETDSAGGKEMQLVGIKKESKRCDFCCLFVCFLVFAFICCSLVFVNGA